MYICVHCVPVWYQSQNILYSRAGQHLKRKTKNIVSTVCQHNPINTKSHPQSSNYCQGGVRKVVERNLDHRGHMLTYAVTYTVTYMDIYWQKIMVGRWPTGNCWPLLTMMRPTAITMMMMMMVAAGMQRRSLQQLAEQQHMPSWHTLWANC